MSLPSPTARGTDAEGGGLLSVRVVVRTPTVESFVEKYCRFVKDDRIFIFTKTSQPTGTRLRFTLELVDGKPLVAGEGTVTRVREDVGDPARPGGMELRFVPIDEASAKLVALMLTEREMLTAPPTQVRDAVPLPPRATLAPLPLTGAHQAYDPPPRAIVPPGPASAKHSPLLTRPVVGAKTDLPRRPGARPTLIGTPMVNPVRASDPIAALARTLALEAPVLPAVTKPVPRAPIVVEEPRREEKSELIPIEIEPAEEPAPAIEPATAPTTEMVTAVDAQPAPVASLLDADSLFAHAAGEAAVVDDDEKTETRSAPMIAKQVAAHVASAEASDELSQSFPGLGQPTQFAEGWRPEAGDSLVPANPFGEVSDMAIEYFVEWSLERSTATGAAPPPSTNFGSIEMRPPQADSGGGNRRAVGIGLAIGLGIGVVAGGILVSLLRRPAPVPTAVAPSASPTQATPTPPPALKPTPTAVAAPAVKAATPAPPPPMQKRTLVAAATPATPVKPTATPVTPTPTPSSAAGEASVDIGSTPPGATVSIDGKERGKTPLSMPLPPGKHDVTLTLDRHVAFHTVMVSPGKLDAQMKRPHSMLLVSSTPAGSDVTINGEAHGKTPLTLTVAEFETYKVDVALPNGKVWHRVVYAKNATVRLYAKLGVVSAKPATSRPALPPPVDVRDPRGRGIQ